MIKEGTVCIKRAGKDAGKKVVVTKVLDENFVIIVGPGIRGKRCNKRHLIPTDKTIEVSGKSDEEILKALEAL